MQEDIFKKILNQFEKIQSNHNMMPDEDFDPSMLEGIISETFKEIDDEIVKISTIKNIKFKRLHPDAVIPSYAFSGDSGFDLYSVEEIEIGPFGRALVPTGLSLEFDENLEIQIRPKSGLAFNKGITVLNTPGTIDKGYTGEIKIIIFNTNNTAVTIEKGMKVAQAVLCPVICGKNVEFIESEILSDSDRKDGGFGSTGLKN